MKYRLNNNDIQELLPLLPMQKNMLYNYLMRQDSELFNEVNVYKIIGQINVDMVIKAWEAVIETNDVLRTIFLWEGLENPVQVVLNKKVADIQILPLSKKTDSAFYLSVLHICQELRQASYNLNHNAFRIRVIRKNDVEIMLIVANHHILFDGWSNALLMHQFKEYYEELVLGNLRVILPDKKYATMIALKTDAEKHVDLSFWKEYLTALPPFLKGGNHEIGVKERYTTVISQELIVKVIAVASQSQCAVSAVYYLAWAITNKFILQTNNIFFGTTFSGRQAGWADNNDCAGLFINTIPFLMQLDIEQRIDKLLSEVAQHLNVLQTRSSDYMLTVCAELGIQEFPNYPSVFVLQNYPIDQTNSSMLNIKIYERYFKSNLDLNVSVQCFDQTGLDFEYNSELYSYRKILEMANVFITSLDSIATDRNQKLSSLLANFSETLNAQMKLGEFNL